MSRPLSVDAIVRHDALVDLRSLCDEEAAVFGAGLLAAVCGLLARYSGQSALLVGIRTPLEGVDQAESRSADEGLVRVWVELADEGTFRQLVRSVQASLDRSFDRPREVPEGDGSFCVGFSYVGDAAGSGQPAGDVDWSPFDIALGFRDAGDGLHGRLLFEPSAFAPRVAARLLECLAPFVAEAGARPDVPLREIPLPSPERELEEALVVPNATAVDVKVRPVHEVVSDQALRTPDAPAIEWEDSVLTYGDLDAAAAGLAGSVSQNIERVGEPVAVYTERSPSMIVSILATLRAGAACVPLDPLYPRERLHRVLALSGARTVVASPGIPPLDGSEGLRWIRAGAPPSGTPDAAAPAVDLASPAYVLFTSGSTGTPKGVVMPHLGLANLIRWQVGASERARPVTLQFAPISFDVAFQEIFSTLAAGGTLVLPTEAERRDPRALLDLMITRRVERAFLPYVALRAVAEELDPERAARLVLDEVVTAGEQLVVTEPIRRMFELLEGARLVNQYGPTETHVVSQHVLDGRPAEWPRLPPIGRPIDNARIYVLGPSGEVVPLGFPGEICVAGDCLADGYVNDRHETERRFQTRVLPVVGEERLYRTGDRARWSEAGHLEFLGREDRQVKVRGVRVEPGEVEAALEERESVAASAVVARRSPDGDTYLVAYVVPVPGKRLEPEEVREALRERVPSFMVPARVEIVTELPLTPSGKVDRDVLVREEQPRRPTSPGSLEAGVLAIFREVLAVDSFGPREDFLLAGGDSLRAARVAARLRQRHGLVANADEILRWGTVEEVLRRAGRDAQPRPDHATPTHARADGAGERMVPLSTNQEALFLRTLVDPEDPSYNVAVALAFEGGLDVDVLRRSLVAIVGRHEILRTVYSWDDDVLVGRVRSMSDEIAGRLITAPDVEPREFAATPFALEREVPIRGGLWRLSPEQSLLVVAVHHIAVDGWSAQLFKDHLIRELRANARPPEPLRPSAVQFGEFARTEREGLAGGAFEPHLRTWERLLAGARSDVDLPWRSGAEAGRPSWSGGHVGATIDGDLRRELVAVAHAERVTLFTVLLAAFYALLARHGNQGGATVGVPYANRPSVEAEAALGYFVNVLPVPLALSRDMTFRELIGGTRAAAATAFSNGIVPLPEIVRRVNPPRAAYRHPLFRVTFQLDEIDVVEWELPGLRIREVDVEVGGAQFDLSLDVRDRTDVMEARLFFRDDALDRGTASALLQDYVSLLGAASSRRDRALSQL